MYVKIPVTAALKFYSNIIRCWRIITPNSRIFLNFATFKPEQNAKIIMDFSTFSVSLPDN